MIVTVICFVQLYALIVMTVLNCILFHFIGLLQLFFKGTDWPLCQLLLRKFKSYCRTGNLEWFASRLTNLTCPLCSMTCLVADPL